ncbi:MAG TPA: DsrE family protein [Egibacteraceae bacterium]|nr:DsrE family protein [Egibacteraceae bacterium]
MADLLFVGSHGTDDPTKAALPFLAATGALANQTDVAVALVAEAPYLMKDAIAKTVLPVGFKPLTELMQQCRDAGVPVYV